MMSIYSCGCVDEDNTDTCIKHGRFPICKSTMSDSETDLVHSSIGNTRIACATRDIVPKKKFDFLLLPPVKEINFEPDSTLQKIFKTASKKHFAYVQCSPIEVAPTILAMEAAGFTYTKSFPVFLATDDSVTHESHYYYGTALVFGTIKIKVPKLGYLGFGALLEQYLINQVKPKRLFQFNATDYRLASLCREINKHLFITTKYLPLYNFILNPDVQMKLDSNGECVKGTGLF